MEQWTKVFFVVHAAYIGKMCVCVHHSIVYIYHPSMNLYLFVFVCIAYPFFCFSLNLLATEIYMEICVHSFRFGAYGSIAISFLFSFFAKVCVTVKFMCLYNENQIISISKGKILSTVIQTFTRR